MNFLITDSEGNQLDSIVSISLIESTDDIDTYFIQALCEVSHIHIEWAEHMSDHYSLWHPMCGRNRSLPQWFCAQKTESCFYRGAPVIATVKANGNIHRSVALLDSKTPILLKYYVNDFNQNNEVIFTVDIFPSRSNYSTILRIDRRNISLYDAIQSVADWWSKAIPNKKEVPEDAYSPVYSTWYNFHQEPEQNRLTDELRIAAELGFKTVILDDGWQIEGKGTKDYLKSGDWLVAADKFPDFKKFVQDVHSFGQKLIVWFSVPFVGYETAAYRRFADKLLFKQDEYTRAGILDIRYPDVRQYIIDTYLRFINDYDIDGLKLDFIDNFRQTKDTPAYNENMDCPNVEDAVLKLLDGIRSSISRIKPDFLYEYRQFYVGPSILYYGNMIRVADCAFDSVTNRIGVVDLRMMTKDIAVHSDMLLWSPDEKIENCALQLLNILFSVPQISVLLKESTEEQIKLLKSHLNYIERNKEVLLKGHLSVKHPEANYSLVSSEDARMNRKITVLYSESACEYSGMNEDIWNATGYDSIVLINKEKYTVSVSVCDCFGSTINRFVTSDEALYVSVPLSGMIHIELCQNR